MDRPKLRRFADRLPWGAAASGGAVLVIEHDRAAVAAFAIAVVLALVASPVLRRVSGATWRDAWWPRREPPWWTQLPSSRASVHELARAGMRIQAVRMYRELTSADLATGVSAVDAMIAENR